MKTYKEEVYEHYRSCFKGEQSEAQMQRGAGNIIPLIKPWVNSLCKSLPVCDLGGGAGALLTALQQLGFTNLAGCDVSPEQVAITRQYFPAFEEADLFDYLRSKPDDYFELITCFDVIEHLTKQDTFDLMHLVRRKLRSGGLFIAHLPNGLSPFSGQVLWGDLTHEWCMTPESARTLCRMTDFAEFEAKEHTGVRLNMRGIIKIMAWSVLRFLYRIANGIETGNFGEKVWTRNFAFKASRP